MVYAAALTSSTEDAATSKSSEPETEHHHIEPLLVSRSVLESSTESSSGRCDAPARVLLSIAILEHDRDAIRRLVTATPEVLQVMNPAIGLSVLSEAVLAGDVSIVRELLALSARLTEQATSAAERRFLRGRSGAGAAGNDGAGFSSSGGACYEIVSDSELARSVDGKLSISPRTGLLQLPSQSRSVGTEYSRQDDHADSSCASYGRARRCDRLPDPDHPSWDSQSHERHGSAERAFASESDLEDDAGSGTDDDDRPGINEDDGRRSDADAALLEAAGPVSIARAGTLATDAQVSAASSGSSGSSESFEPSESSESSEWPVSPEPANSSALSGAAGPKQSSNPAVPSEAAGSDKENLTIRGPFLDVSSGSSGSEARVAARLPDARSSLTGSADRIDAINLVDPGWWTRRYQEQLIDYPHVARHSPERLPCECELAIYRDDADILDALLEAGAPLTDDASVPLLEIALDNLVRTPSLPIIKVLVGRGACEHLDAEDLAKLPLLLNLLNSNGHGGITQYLLPYVMALPGERASGHFSSGVMTLSKLELLRQTLAALDKAGDAGHWDSLTRSLLEQACEAGWYDGASELLACGVRIFPHRMALDDPLLKSLRTARMLQLVCSHVHDARECQRLLDLALVNAAMSPPDCFDSGEIAAILALGADLRLDLRGIMDRDPQGKPVASLMELAFNCKNFRFFVESLSWQPRAYVNQQAEKWISVAVSSDAGVIRPDAINNAFSSVSSMQAFIDSLQAFPHLSHNKSFRARFVMEIALTRSPVLWRAMLEAGFDPTGIRWMDGDDLLTGCLSRDTALTTALFLTGNGIDSQLTPESVLKRPSMASRPHACDVYRFRQVLLQPTLAPCDELNGTVRWDDALLDTLFMMSLIDIDRVRTSNPGLADFYLGEQAWAAHTMGISAMLFDYMLRKAKAIPMSGSLQRMGPDAYRAEWELKMVAQLKAMIMGITDGDFILPLVPASVNLRMRVIISYQAISIAAGISAASSAASPASSTSATSSPVAMTAATTAATTAASGHEALRQRPDQ